MVHIVFLFGFPFWISYGFPGQQWLRNSWKNPLVHLHLHISPPFFYGFPMVDQPTRSSTSPPFHPSFFAQLQGRSAILRGFVQVRLGLQEHHRHRGMVTLRRDEERRAAVLRGLVLVRASKVGRRKMGNAEEGKLSLCMYVCIYIYMCVCVCVSVCVYVKLPRKYQTKKKLVSCSKIVSKKYCFS